MHKDSIKIDSTLKYETLLNHRTVYGAGGIIPDVFVPLDTTDGSDEPCWRANDGCDLPLCSCRSTDQSDEPITLWIYRAFNYLIPDCCCLSISGG